MRFHIFLMFLFIHDIFYARILYMLHKKCLVVDKKLCSVDKKILRIEVRLRTKIM